MKKLFIAILLVAANMQFAQSSESATVATPTETTIDAKDSKKCAALMQDAQWYFKHKEFGKAKDKLNELLAINPNDQQAKILLEQCGKSTTEYGESAEKKKNNLSFGFIIGADQLSKQQGTHLGFTMRYGHYSDLFNATAGAEIIFQQSKKDYSGIFKGYDDKVTLGGQIIIPVMAKFNLLKCTENTRFYAGAGAELGVKLYSKDVNIGYTYNYGEHKDFIGGSTVAGLVQVGVTGRHFDVGIYYRHYFNDLVDDFFPEYQESGRVGMSLAYYF